jgi:hypothetical protein
MILTASTTKTKKATTRNGKYMCGIYEASNESGADSFKQIAAIVPIARDIFERLENCMTMPNA